MEKVFNQFKNMLIVHANYKGYVCGYNDSHVILAIESTSKDFFRKMQNPIILEQYKDAKYRYAFEDEKELIKQSQDEEYKKTNSKN